LSPHDRLRRSLHEALPADPGFPSPDLLDRIIDDLTAPVRPAQRGSWRPWRWLPAVAALLVAVVVGDVLLVPRPFTQTFVGRVEFVSGHVMFLSSAAQPAQEYQGMTHDVLAGFNGTVDFNSQPTAAQDIERIGYERKTGQSTIDLVALTTSDMVELKNQDALEDLTPLLERLRRDRQFPPSFVAYGRFGTGKQYFIPWLQATYMMVVNRRAFAYLPAGVDYNHLTYDQLIAWGQNIEAATGDKRIGLPAGGVDSPRGGLIYRFLQGYAYPSYTGATLTEFRSPEAVQMWEMQRRLWAVTNPQSMTYTRMDEPLASGDVWIAWDHQARLKAALSDPEQFVAIPAPSGPHGLGYLSVVVGLAIPKHAPNRDGAEALVDWLTRPRQQAAASMSVSYFPVVEDVAVTGAQRDEQSVAQAYQADRKRLETLLPAGLGPLADQYTAIHQETFARIVLQGEDIRTVLNEEAARLQPLVNDARAPCWTPDPPSRGPCQIK
jgi:multiple sugar transport system substrate-binding protein